MIKNIAVRFAACAVFVLAASETLQAAELTHRWSFNGDCLNGEWLIVA